VEKALILKTLEDTGGNRSRAAEVLGINRRTLQMKLREYGM
jgi:two-component system response regulator HydG